MEREEGKRKEISGKVSIKIEEGRDDWLGFRGTSFGRLQSSQEPSQTKIPANCLLEKG
jgi:hypothetical protein